MILANLVSCSMLSSRISAFILNPPLSFTVGVFAPYVNQFKAKKREYNKILWWNVVRSLIHVVRSFSEKYAWSRDKNVLKVIDRYHGTYDIDTEDNIFSFSVLIPDEDVVQKN